MTTARASVASIPGRVFAFITVRRTSCSTIIKCNIKFNKEVVNDLRFKVINPRHSEYPKGKCTNDIVYEIRSKVPEKYRTSVEPILQQWLTALTTGDSSSKELLGQKTCKHDLSHPYKLYVNLA